MLYFLLLYFLLHTTALLYFLLQYFLLHATALLYFLLLYFLLRHFKLLKTTELLTSVSHFRIILLNFRILRTFTLLIASRWQILRALLKFNRILSNYFQTAGGRDPAFRTIHSRQPQDNLVRLIFTWPIIDTNALLTGAPVLYRL